MHPASDYHPSMASATQNRHISTQKTPVETISDPDSDSDSDSDSDYNSEDELTPLPLKRKTRAMPGKNNVNEGTLVLTDVNVLECPICFHPLSPPVFQYRNGHVACSTCRSNVKKVCPSCRMPVSKIRCRAIEKVIESVKILCQNASNGCKETMAYNKKSNHGKLCPHVTCFCPFPSCHYANSSKNLYLHFGNQHATSATRFSYNTSFTTLVNANQKHILLQEQHEGVIFILNHEVKEHGRAFSIDCVGPSTLKSSFEYQLTTKGMGATLSFQCVPEIYAKWPEHTLKLTYLTVPSDFPCNNGVVSLDVSITKTL